MGRVVWVVKLPAFFVILIYEILKANWQFLRFLFSTESWQSVLFAYPLKIQHPLGRHLLALSITMTPGTVTVDWEPQKGILVVHALMATQGSMVIPGIFQGLERWLIWVFEGGSLWE